MSQKRVQRYIFFLTYVQVFKKIFQKTRNSKKIGQSVAGMENYAYLCTRNSEMKQIGAIAQLVEQRTENPCVPGSIPGGTTLLKESLITSDSFLFYIKSATLNAIHARRSRPPGRLLLAFCTLSANTLPSNSFRHCHQRKVQHNSRDKTRHRINDIMSLDVYR